MNDKFEHATAADDDELYDAIFSHSNALKSYQPNTVLNRSATKMEEEEEEGKTVGNVRKTMRVK